MTNPTQNQALLEQLRDIQYPEPLSWWPLAPGWYILSGILVLITTLSCIWILRYLRKLRTKKNILGNLDQIRNKIKKEPHSTRLWAELSSFLKRFALLIYPKQDIEGLHGEAWLQFLNTQGRTKEFTDGIGALIISAPYQSKPPEQAEALLELIERWVRQQIKEKL